MGIFSRAKEISGFPGYKITKCGLIKSPYSGKLISYHWRGSNGGSYPTVTLFKKGTRIKKMIHVLVAIAYIKKIKGKDFVNHKDKNRRHFHKDNLEWTTHAENCKHRSQYDNIKI